MTLWGEFETDPETTKVHRQVCVCELNRTILLAIQFFCIKCGRVKIEGLAFGIKGDF